MRCAHCSKSPMVEIKMRIGGEDVIFRRCGRCETKAWESADGALPLHRVLEKARSSR